MIGLLTPWSSDVWIPEGLPADVAEIEQTAAELASAVETTCLTVIVDATPFIVDGELHALDDALPVGRKLAESETSDVVDAHLVVVAEMLGDFILTGDPDDMTALSARFETY